MQIIKTHNPLLYIKCEPVDFEKEDFQPEIIEMTQLMDNDPIGGVGLAANQAGLNRQIFIMRTELKNNLIVVINPEITARSGNIVTDLEKCLSFPNRGVIIKRPDEIEARYFNVMGKPVVKGFVGFDAVVFQHEFDHLQGITMFDRAKMQKKKKKKKRRK